METRDPHLTHWRVIDTFRLREGCADDWRVTSHRMAIRAAAKHNGGPAYELVDKRREVIPSWRRRPIAGARRSFIRIRFDAE